MHHSKIVAIGVTVLCAVFLTSCSTFPGTRAKTSPPVDPNALTGPVEKDSIALPDPIPKKEKLSKAGNPKTYKVHGKRYQVMATSKGFRQRGLASWYGPKFHGRRTSSGERFNMHAITAAHKRLPIPAYVRVKRLDNGRSIVVRINDRGPFISGRIIDLSYAAARKLGMLKHGTVPVEVVALSPHQEFPQAAAADKNNATPAPRSLAQNPSPASRLNRFYLQVGAFNQRQSAEKLQRNVKDFLGHTTMINFLNGLHKVRVGPFSDRAEIDNLSNRLIAMGLEQPQIIYE